ncbi:hypothetical protein BDW68DRAFT_150992 [Aspergillus falconensis]
MLEYFCLKDVMNLLLETWSLNRDDCPFQVRPQIGYFSRLPRNIRILVLGYLCPTDFADLRRASRSFERIPFSF